MTRRKRREAMPDAVKRRAAKSRVKSEKLFTAPEVEVLPEGFRSPYRSQDEGDWWRLLGEAFGTRMESVIRVFLEQVARLTPQQWDEEAQRNVPDPTHLNAALAIVASMKPRNEAEAAQAAQAFALHIATMKVGAGIAKHGSVDPRQANALANLVKSYSGVMNSLNARRGSRSSRQTIVVKKQVNISNDNRSVTLPGGGLSAADRPDASGSNTRARLCTDCGTECGTYGDARCPALLGPDQGPKTLRLAGRVRA